MAWSSCSAATSSRWTRGCSRREDPARRSALDEAIATTANLLGRVRDLSLDLRPSLLDDLGLVAALRWFAKRFAGRTGLEVHVQAGDFEPRLPAEVETACFRVVQESLTNAARHSGARQAWVQLHRDGEAVTLTVRDDGAGFDPDAARRTAAAGRSLGLLGMEERVRLLGGQLAIDSAPGRGTTIRIGFPAGSKESDRRGQ